MASIFESPSRRLPPLGPRLSLHEEVVARLRDMILDGVLPPGEWIAEMKLCDDLSISRTPLREALKVLASENLVTLMPNRGAMVTDILVDEIVEIFEIMTALEGLLGTLAAQRATDEEIETLQAAHKTMITHFEQRRRTEYFAVNLAIHQSIADLSGNRALANTYAGFAGKIRRARSISDLSAARWTESAVEHEIFMAALAERDAKLFASLLQDHSRKTAAMVCEGLRQRAALNLTK
jgi:DNA-binding GntR family transcriptional regulator